jgi:phosphinothricin acetyltransferase
MVGTGSGPGRLFSSMTDIVVRDSTSTDIPEITALYAHHVRTGASTFEITPPDEAEVLRRRQTVLVEGLP